MLNTYKHLTDEKAIGSSETDLWGDIEKLKQEMQRVGPGHESELMRLLLARVTQNSIFQFTGLLDNEGRMLEPSYSALRAAGITAKDVIGLPIWEATWWQGIPKAQQELKEAVHKASLGEFVRYDTENVLAAQGNRVITVDFSLNPIKDREGRVVFMAIEGRDVTKQRQLAREIEEARQISEARFKRLVDSNIIGIFTGNTQEGTFVEANDYVLNMLGYTRAELENGTLNWRKLTPPEYKEIDEWRVTELLEKGILMLTGVPNLGPVESRDFPRIMSFKGESRNESQSIHRRADSAGLERGGNGWEDSSSTAA